MLEGHIHKRTFDQKRTFRETARNRKNMSSQARPNFLVGLRLIRRYRLRNLLSENSPGAADYNYSVGLGKGGLIRVYDDAGNVTETPEP